MLFCLHFYLSLGQSVDFQKIKGLPTEEVYDVFSDSKGFIWVAHSLGICRYDGKSFTYFQDPQNSFLAGTNICEDKQGKIWFHDFNGNIYYITNEKVNLYATYTNVNEISFPTIIINGDDLFVTSIRGLFICNTQTLKGRYVPRSQKIVTSQSIAVCNNTVIIFDRHQASIYRNNHLINVPISSENRLLFKKYNIGFTLAPLVTSDTIYAYNNDLFLKLILRHDTLCIINEIKLDGMINTITASGGAIWVNTKKISVRSDLSEKIVGKNLTDYVVDRWGNKWLGSLQMGLLEKPSYSKEEKINIRNLGKNDFIHCIGTIGNTGIFGTQRGKIIVTKDNKTIDEFQFAADAGAIEHIFVMPGNRLIVAPSIGLYYLNLNSRYLYRLSDNGTVKDITVTDSTILFARSADMVKIPITSSLKSFLSGALNTNSEKEFSYELRTKINNDNGTPVVASRCYSLSYDPVSKRILGLFKNGLGEIINDHIHYWTRNNLPILASCLIQTGNTVFIGSLNQGLLIYHNKDVENISTDKGLFSNMILKMKIFGNQLILIEPNTLQIWDLNKHLFTTTLPLPADQGTVYDFIKKDGDIYLTFVSSMYKFSATNNNAAVSPIYLLEAKAIKSNKLIDEGSSLNYNDNNVSISVTSPVFVHPEAMYLMYRLKGDYDSAWNKYSGSNNVFSFVALKPGNYSFECYSMNFQNVRSPNTFNLHFTISTPLWDKWWFRAFGFILVISILLLFFRRRVKKIKATDQLIIDKLTLQNDLRKSLLRTIIAQMNPHFIFNALNTIQSFVYRNDKKSVSNYMGKFSELIRKILHSSNTDSITLSEEIEILNLYIELEKARFENELTISLNVGDEIDPESVTIPPMFIQPLIENAIKHGLFHKKGLKELNILIEKDPDKNNYILITIDDNGIGREHSNKINNKMKKSYLSFATSAMSIRINLINQTLNNKIYLKIIDKPNGEGTIVRIELPLLNELI
ncbi:MAG: hypothetical protein NVSMB45_09790 [Ginsengibacter sp.]